MRIGAIKRLFLLLCTLSLIQADTFLDVEEAFQYRAERFGDELRVSFVIAEGYYLYQDRYQLLPFEGASVGEPQFSDNLQIKYDPNFDEDMAVFYQRMEVSQSLVGEQGYLQIVYQGCADEGLCYAPQKRYIDLAGQPIASPVASQPLLLNEFNDLPAVSLSALGSTEETASSTPVSVFSALLLAVAGGLILNLMPCVFPVLSLKAISLSQLGQDAHHRRLHGLVYSLGVVLSFLAIAALLLVLRAVGEWVGWGFQLQSPYFVAALVLLFYVMALAMAGYFELGQSLMGIGQGLTEKSGATGSFFTGVLATVVATPCTAPFMGTAIGFALTQPAAISLFIFAAMGGGLALPILLLSFLPGLSRWLPKPGKWMLHFRQLMAFPLFATVLWLLWVLVELTASSALLSVGLGLILFTLALWPALSSRDEVSRVRRWLKSSLRYGAFVAALVLVFDQREEPSLWQPYSPERLAASLAQGQSVFVDVTAAWCITCKVNERVALSGNSFERLVRQNDILLLKADWTNPSPQVDSLIASFDRDGVPLYIFYDQGSPIGELLPQVLTAGLIETTFRQGDS